MLAAEQSSPSQKAARREAAVLLADALAQLPKHYREVIYLHHFRQLTFRELGEKTGRSEENARKIWARAVVALRRVLGEQSDDLL